MRRHWNTNEGETSRLSSKDWDPLRKLRLNIKKTSGTRWRWYSATEQLLEKHSFPSDKNTSQRNAIYMGYHLLLFREEDIPVSWSQMLESYLQTIERKTAVLIRNPSGYYLIIALKWEEALWILKTFPDGVFSIRSSRNSVKSIAQPEP